MSKIKNHEERSETAIIVVSTVSLPMARVIKNEIKDAIIYTKEKIRDCTAVPNFHTLVEENFQKWKQLIFFGATGICAYDCSMSQEQA